MMMMPILNVCIILPPLRGSDMQLNWTALDMQHIDRWDQSRVLQKSEENKKIKKYQQKN